MSEGAATSAPSKGLRAVWTVLFVALLAAFVWFALNVDVFCATAPTAFAKCFQLGIAFTASTPALAVAWMCRRQWMTATYCVALAAIVALAFLPWHPRKQFVADLHSLEKGMTVDQVEAVMGRYLKGAGSKWAVPETPPPPVLGPGESPSPEVEESVRRAQEDYKAPAYPSGDERAHANGTMTYRWNDHDSMYDSDWGQVTFEDGRVVVVAFLPD